jgi:hypothetical protein
MMNHSIKPGQVWTDTQGKRIQAHGGSVCFLNGTYYWYGENKEFTTGENDVWTWGIRCYTSKDLYNWQDMGLIIPPDTEDRNSPLHPSSKLDRPHILFNRRTNQYVCWIKVMNADNTQTMTVLTADDILGPYTMVHERLRPLGMSSGDFDLATDADGKAYFYFERVHDAIICAELNDDYTDVTGVYSTHFLNLQGPPDVREAPCHFLRGGKHYLITSGTSSYFPNPSEAAVADAWHGPFRVLGNPHVGDPSNTSFHSQISCVFRVEGKSDLYIACADRWLPEALHADYEGIERFFRLCMKGQFAEAQKVREELALPTEDHTAIADYVWLPIVFDGENVRIEWRDEWRIEDFR